MHIHNYKSLYIHINGISWNFTKIMFLNYVYKRLPKGNFKNHGKHMISHHDFKERSSGQYI